MNRGNRIAFVTRHPNAFTDRLIRGMTSALSRLREKQVPVALREFELHDMSQSLPPGYQAWSPDAAIVVLGGDREELHDKLKLEEGIPLIHNVAVGQAGNEAVVLNDATSAYNAAHNHFREIGLNRVAGLFMGDELVSHLMMNRYRQFCQGHGVDCELVHSPEDFVEDYADPNGLLTLSGPVVDWLQSQREPVGIFTQHSYTGAHLCRLCKALGRHVPDDVAIIGSDGFDVSLWPDPPLTSLYNNAEQVGIKSIELALDMIGGAPAPDNHVRVSGTKVIVRGSTVAKRPRGLDIAEAIRFIDEHAFDGITMLDVVEHTQGVSRKTFVKHFKAWTAMTPSQAIRKRKLDKSRRILRDTDMSITALSRACGFCDDIEFRKVFGKEEGCSPSMYRKNRRGHTA